MTPEERERIARSIYTCWNEDGVEALASRWWTEDIVWEDDPTLPDADVHRGRDVAAEQMDVLVDAIGEFELEMLRFEPVGDDSGLARCRLVSQAPGSGIPIDIEYTHFVTFRGNRVSHVRVFLDHDAAMAAAQATR